MPTSEPRLFLVATPIGNLDDISRRAVATLAEVDLVASEDTRKTGRLLKHLGLNKPQVSFYEHNEERATQQILARLRQGQSVALVTSAGTPGVADPGYTVVRACIAEDIPFTLIPGASAFVAALVLSGLPSHAFTFRGFLPRKAGARRRFYQADAVSPNTLIYYESPHRLLKSLQDALDVLGDRPAALANDLTKMYEQVHRGSLSELLNQMSETKLLGEFVLVIAGARPDA